MGQFALVASAIAGVVGTVASVSAQKKAADLANKQQALQNRRSQRQALREAQIRRAQATSASVAGGSNFGSGLAGGLSSLSSQLGSNMGYAAQMSGLNAGISNLEQKAKSMSAAAEFGFGTFKSLGGFDFLKGV